MTTKQNQHKRLQWRSQWRKGCTSEWIERRKKTHKHNRYSSSSMVSCIFYRAISWTNIQACIHVHFILWMTANNGITFHKRLCVLCTVRFFSFFILFKKMILMTICKRYYIFFEVYKHSICALFMLCGATVYAMDCMRACKYMFVCSLQPFIQMVHIIHYFVTA